MGESTTIDVNSEIPGGYRLLRLVGRGNFAKVWEASGPSGEKVAVKILASTHPQAHKRFLREIKVIRSLPENQHVVRYLDHGALLEGTPFLVLEFVLGFTLGQLLSTGRRFSEQAACALMVQLCKAFQGLHSLGVTHGDIKPNNIMLAKSASAPPLAPSSKLAKDVIHLAQVERSALRIKLLDFGLIRDAQGLLRLFEEHEMLPGKDFGEELDVGMLAGTPEYIAPEQLADARREDHEEARTDTPSDVYGLGIVFYQLLTGAVPWPFEPDGRDQDTYRQSVRDYLDQRIGGQMPIAPPGISSALWSIIARALEPDAKKRQGDAMALAKDIERYMEFGVGVPANLDTQETAMVYLGDSPGASHPGTVSREAPTAKSDAPARANSQVQANAGARGNGSASRAPSSPGKKPGKVGLAAPPSAREAGAMAKGGRSVEQQIAVRAAKKASDATPTDALPTPEAEEQGAKKRFLAMAVAAAAVAAAVAIAIVISAS